MPELPEVETTLRGLQPHVEGQKIQQIIIRHPTLRWPIPLNIKQTLKDQVVKQISRRGKYLLFETGKGTLILHLGMSGSLRVLTQKIPAKKHDHIDIIFFNNITIRLTDPRRFGACLFTNKDPREHALLKNLGPEPLDKLFHGKYLYQSSLKRKVAIKAFIMDSKVVVGVGNIYATEALFAARIHPLQAAGQMTLEQSNKLVKEIKKILRAAIQAGGTTLKDFLKSDGKPGYFKFHLKAYGRAGLPCVRCKAILEEIRLGQRSSVFCSKCQK